jgi:predicted nucleic acid-binding Zn ribbon protein
MIHKALREQNQTRKRKHTIKRDALAILAPLVVPIVLPLRLIQ